MVIQEGAFPKTVAEVLVVEDNYLNQFVTRRFLTDHGLNVTVANDGTEALAILQKKHVDVVLMDIQMPGLDGYETATAIRALDDEHFKRVPIIACTGSMHEDTRINVTKFGLNDFVIKPFTSEQIIEKIHQFTYLWATPLVTS